MEPLRSVVGTEGSCFYSKFKAFVRAEVVVIPNVMEYKKVQDRGVEWGTRSGGCPS